MNIANVDLNLLLVFEALMAERSVTHAAARVGLSQPALSNALNRLRGCFGDRLFVKGWRTMLPTPRALELAPEIEAALRHIRAAFHAPEFRPESSQRVFRLATSDDMELSFLPALARELLATAPGITVNCRRLAGIFSLPQEELQSGALDFALGLFSSLTPVKRDLFARELYELRMVCIARARHPRIKRRLTLSHFRQLEHVATFYPGEGPGLMDRILGERGFQRKVRLSLPHWLPVPFVVANSDLIATVPETVAKALGPASGLRCLRCPVNLPPLRVSLIWHARTQESAAHIWFRSLLARVGRGLERKQG